MLGDTPQPTGGGTKADHREVVTHDADSAWDGREVGGKQER